MLGRLVVLALLGAVLVAPLSACGKKGAWKAPEGSQYPHKYPKE